ncbi:hypothetical protein [Planobispora rosea]|uniref:hypothetical protein n=1 Tax=Planobispora rosea TaxID=35762 RepID=UPI00114CC2CC|nr:hypothetical protein [Planobispora rosea]
MIIVMDPTDDASVTAAALAAHNPTAGRITVHPTPDTSSVQTLAHDLLAALGKPLHRLGEEKILSARPAWQAALAWLSGEAHQQLIVLRTHLMNETRWEHLLKIPVLTGTQLLLVYHTTQLGAVHQSMLTPLSHQITDDISHVLRLDHSGEDSYPSHSDPPATSIPPLPRIDFPHFRAEMRRQLSDDQFAVADAEYAYGIEHACLWLTRHPEYRSTISPARKIGMILPLTLRADELDAGVAVLQQGYSKIFVDELSEGILCLGRLSPNVKGYPHPWRDEMGLQIFLCELVANALSPRHTLARLRGAQAGFLMHGVLLNMPIDLDLLHGPGITSTPLTSAIITRIRSHTAHPQHAAALAASLFTNIDVPILASTRVDHLSSDASHLQAAIPNSAFYAVPPHARALMRAARKFTQLHLPEPGREPPQYLFRPAIGREGQHLEKIAKVCGFTLPVLPNRNPHSPWHRQVACWRVSDPLHGPEADMRIPHADREAPGWPN